MGLKLAHKVTQSVQKVSLFSDVKIRFGRYFSSLSAGYKGWTEPDFEVTEKESMATSMFKKWMHIFSNFKFPGKILDHASCHFDANIVHVAESNDNIPFVFPVNCTRVYNL